MFVEAGFVNASVIEGEGSINGRKIKKEIIFIIPADFGTCHIELREMVPFKMPVI